MSVPFRMQQAALRYQTSILLLLSTGIHVL